MNSIFLLAMSTIKLLALIWIADGDLFKPPNDLGELCPLTSFCSRTPEAAVLRPGYEACCQSCGCDAECGRRRDCCTNEMDTWRLDEQNSSTCVSPVLFTGQSEKLSTFWYHMVDQCTNITHDCISDRPYPWGSMYPHSSLTDGFVYYNEFCALCNANSSLVPWQLIVACQMEEFGGNRDSYTHKVELSLNGRSGEVGCFLYFIPPPELDVRHERCFPEENILRHCNNESKYTNVILKDLQNKCSSFNATYTHHSVFSHLVFANVYCFLCDERLTRPQSECKIQEEPSKLLPDQSFVMVLDNVRDMLDQPTISSMNRVHCYQDICRPVHCPEGRISMDGACKHIYLVVGTLCNMYFKLRFREPVDGFGIDALENFASNNLSMHGLNGWNVTIFVVAYLNSSAPNYLIARAFKYLKNRNLDRIVATVERSLKQPWKLTVPGRSWSFSVSFYKYTRFDSIPSMSDDKIVTVGPYWWHSLNMYLRRSNHERIVVLNRHWLQMANFEIHLKPATFLVITKMFFCDQAELLATEFVDLENEIYLMGHNRTLQEGEFTRVSESHGGEKIRVCLDEIIRLKTQNETSDFFTTTINAIYVAVALRLLIVFLQ